MKYLSIMGLIGLVAAYATPGMMSTARAADIASAECSSAKDAVNPPFCKAVRGDRAEGWLAQGRSEVMARNGIVTTSQPLAAEAGLEMLRKGGNAIDAAVATAAALGLVEPMKTGMAGDLFAIIYTAKDHKLHVLNASGMAASGQTLAYMNAQGYKFTRDNGPGSGMPRAGVLTVTVPGSVWGWQEVLDKYGTMSFKQVLQPTVDYAEQGFPISERIASDWSLPKAISDNPASSAGCCTAVDPDSVKNWYIDGKKPKAGQIFRNPDMAKTLRLLQAGGRDAFYKGEIARAMVAKIRALGGTMTADDLANYKGEWVDPVMTDYKGYTLAEVPPPSQGFAANEMLNIVQACIGTVYPGQTLASMGPTDPRYWHLLVEAKKIAYTDLNKYNGDPNFNPGLMDQVRKTFLSADYAKAQCGRIDPAKASALATGNASGDGDTIVLSTADRWGNMVSWVNSLYANFGSGVTVPGYGLMLHNRGGLFTLDPKSPNVIAPHKRPYNTLAAGFVLQGGRTDGQLMSLLLMGGDMQAQGHAQMLINMVDLGANPQASTDMARFHHNQVRNVLQLESQLYNQMGAPLKAMGHNVMSVNGAGMGGYQALLFTPDPKETPVPAGRKDGQVNGVYRAGTDHRKDGIATGW
ncbi:MAG TPA: gamma-glutamyltransferase family protein [Rhizomicrobium sp.]|jgi:gamma-glutamyltranspeptidase/glutathione hydrolase